MVWPIREDVSAIRWHLRLGPRSKSTKRDRSWANLCANIIVQDGPTFDQAGSVCCLMLLSGRAVKLTRTRVAQKRAEVQLPDVYLEQRSPVVRVQEIETGTLSLSV